MVGFYVGDSIGDGNNAYYVGKKHDDYPKNIMNPVSEINNSLELNEAKRLLSDFVISEISYMQLNNLGDPYKQQNVREALKFLLGE